MAPMTRLAKFTAFVLIFLGCAAASAEERAPVPPATILTVAGKIANTNREPFDASRDLFMAHFNLTFDKARTYSRSDLGRLPQHEVRVKALKLPEAVYAGPLLRDVLKDAGASGGTVRIVGLDGYSPEFAAADLEKADWILALTRDGKPLGIGGLGPLWLMHSVPGGDATKVAEEEHWAWAVFYVEVR